MQNVTKSAIESYYARREEQELRGIKLERQRILEYLYGEVHEEVGSEDSTQTLPLSDDEGGVLEKNHVTRNGTSGKLTRRKMLRAIFPDYRGKKFERKDVEAEIFRRWPEVKPKTEKESKSFTSGIAALMTDFVEKGQLGMEKGDTPFEPRTYWVREDIEDTLLKPDS